MKMNFNQQTKRQFCSKVFFKSESFGLNVIPPVLSSEYRFKKWLFLAKMKWQKRPFKVLYLYWKLCIKFGVSSS